MHKQFNVHSSRQKFVHCLAAAFVVVSSMATADADTFTFGSGANDLLGAASKTLNADGFAMNLVAGPAGGGLWESSGVGGMGVDASAILGPGGLAARFDRIIGVSEFVEFSFNTPGILTGINFDGVKDESFEYFVLESSGGLRINFFDSAANITIPGAIDNAIAQGVVTGQVVYLLEGNGFDDEVNDLLIPSAEFNGRDARIEIPADLAPRLKTGDFTIAAWISVDEALDDVPGDIISQYDSVSKRGYHLTLKINAGVTTTQANLRQLQFGIDNARDTDWLDCGRPGNATLAFALTSFDGHLWAGTSHPGKDEVGRVYRHEQKKEWIDCGAPVQCNSVTALAEFDGHLYAGTGKYRFGGSALAESENTHLGGNVLRYDGPQRWTDCGTLPGVEAIGGMVVFRNRLYASSLYKPAGFFRYEGGTRWTALPTPALRVEALGVYNGYLYATSYDGGQVFRFDGDAWEECGALGGVGENSQTYSFAVHAGRLFVGTWPSGKVYRFEEANRWMDVGRLGEELEVMGMLVHNGRLLAGTLPLADVYEYAAGSQWRKLTRLDPTPNVKYRRAWTMAEFNGRVFCSTLPSGHIYSYQAGASVMSGSALPAGWRHVAAVKRGDRLQLYVEGEQIARSASLDATQYELNVDKPLQIGFGQNDYFLGRMRDVRIYDRSLEVAELEELAR